MKTTRNSPRARKERAVAKRFLRLHRLTERELIALPYDRLTPMPEAYREWKKLARRPFLFAEAGGFITKEGFQAWHFTHGHRTWQSPHETLRYNIKLRGSIPTC